MPLPKRLQRLRWHHVLALMLGASFVGAGAAVLIDGLTAVIL